MIELIQKICREKDVHCYGCPFSMNNHLKSSKTGCMFLGIPEGWDIEEIKKAFDNTIPTRPKGQWIDADAKCPCCGKNKFDGLDADIWCDWKPKYCPNCGADMREGEE